jgi:hypothetical protein
MAALSENEQKMRKAEAFVTWVEGDIHLFEQRDFFQARRMAMLARELLNDGLSIFMLEDNFKTSHLPSRPVPTLIWVVALPTCFMRPSAEFRSWPAMTCAPL